MPSWAGQPLKQALVFHLFHSKRDQIIIRMHQIKLENIGYRTINSLEKPHESHLLGGGGHGPILERTQVISYKLTFK